VNCFRNCGEKGPEYIRWGNQRTRIFGTLGKGIFALGWFQEKKREKELFRDRSIIKLKYQQDGQKNVSKDSGD